MKILIKNGKVLKLPINGKAISKKAYAALWGYNCSIQDNTTHIYDKIFKCFSDGIDAETEFTRISVDLSEFAIAEDNIPLYKGGKRDKLYNLLSRVALDNPHLCYHNRQSNFVSEEGLIKSVSIVVPNNTVRGNAQTKFDTGVADATVKVKTVCGISPGDVLTWSEKRNVAKILHDWIMQRTFYKTSSQTADSYYSQLAYSALTDENNVKPVCGGYAEAMAYLLQLYNITSTYVVGTVHKTEGDVSHAWVFASFELPFGVYSNNPEDWTSIDVTWDDKRYDGTLQGSPWEYFCTSKVYHDNGGTEETRDNAVTFKFPVNVPTKYYPYYGNTLYGIADSDWQKSSN